MRCRHSSHSKKTRVAKFDVAGENLTDQTPATYCPIRQGIRQRFGSYDAGVAAGLQLRHDHGSHYLSNYLQAELRFLRIESSPAFVRTPEGNGCAERLIRTLKEQLLCVRIFDTIEELRQALHQWLATYNEYWLIEPHGHRPPAQVRRDLLAIQEAA